MKKFFSEFKKFITRGNVMDMAVGVIVGGAFTAIVNGLSNFILKPLINYLLAILLGKDTLSEIVTMLLPAYTTDEAGNQVLDLANSIYLDWGSFINAIINFFLIAFVLFCIVRVFNRVRENQKELTEKAKNGKISKEDRKAIKAAGIKLRDKEAVAAWFAAKAEKEAADAAAAAAAAEEQARLDRLANPTTEDLLKQILAEIKKD
ncbi:MAG: large conductance mechanosensitive channel protein MscL [Clostridia bacterium]|nr:large conductance mechanosensitive channel protein MscL [Clostridia bacterium]